MYIYVWCTCLDAVCQVTNFLEQVGMTDAVGPRNIEYWTTDQARRRSWVAFCRDLGGDGVGLPW